MTQLTKHHQTQQPLKVLDIVKSLVIRCVVPLNLKLFLDNKTGGMFWEQQQIGYTKRAVKGTNTKNKSNIREIKYQYTFLKRENS